MLFVILQGFGIRGQTADSLGIPLVRKKIAGIEPGVVLVINRAVVHANLIFREVSKDGLDAAFVIFPGVTQILPGIGDIGPQTGLRRIGQGVGHRGWAGFQGRAATEYQLPKEKHLTAFRISIKTVQGIGLLAAVHVIFPGRAVGDADSKIGIVVGKCAAVRRDGVGQNDDRTNGGIVPGPGGLWQNSRRSRAEYLLGSEDAPAVAPLIQLHYREYGDAIGMRRGGNAQRADVSIE